MESRPPGETAGRSDDEDAAGRTLSVRWALGFYAGLAVLAAAVRLWWDGALPWWAPGGGGGGYPAALVDLGLGAAVGAVLVFGSRAWTTRTETGRELAEALREVLGPLGARDCALLALASGLAEEALFRGALQPALGFGWATLAFTLAHWIPRKGLWTWALFAALAGALFGGLFWWRGSLLAPATAHVVVNGLNLHWLARQSPPAARDAVQERPNA